MSLNISGEKCAVCKAYLFAEDDVVYCPECGAPHHRECYQGVGNCALSEYHGTDKQYQKPTQSEEIQTAENTQNNTDSSNTVCQMCGHIFSRDESACPQCGAPNVSKMGGRFIRFDFLGGVPSDMDLGEGVTADEAKQFVFSNTQRYIPKFARIKSGKKLSWNWAAFLFPSAWFLSRKMHNWGAFAATLQVAFTMLIYPFYNAISFLDFSNTRNYFETSNIILENISSIGTTAIAVAFLGIVLDFVLRILCGAFGDLIYKNRVISKIVEIKASDKDQTEGFDRKGGVSLTRALIGIMVVQYAPAILASLIGIF